MAATVPDVTFDPRTRLMDLRVELLDRLSDLRRGLAAASASQELEGTRANHPADEASDVIVAETDLSEMRYIEAEIRDIDDALARVEHGTWGICETCGSAIDPGRLEVLPHARRCLACQEIDDRLTVQA